MENKKIIEYQTLRCHDGPADEAVARMIARGWQPYGPPTNYYMFSDRFGIPYLYWAQTMVLYQEDADRLQEAELAKNKTSL